MPQRLVLVVEDDPHVRRLLTELLQTAGLRVATLPDGERVVDAARELRPDAIALDIALPGRHGLQVLGDLRSAPDVAGIPVVVITAWRGPDLVGQALAAGAVDYIRKPFATEVCVARIVAAMSVAPRELTEDVRRLLRVDRLTGLPNRVGLEELFDERLATAQVRGVPLALVMVRVDRYDELSHWGDPAATEVLMRRLADDLGCRVRPGDAIGRLAEDTFLIIAPGCGLAEAGRVAEELRAGADGVHARATWTVSAGYAATDACQPDELLGCCDLALTLAAEAGGNLSRAGVPAGRLKVA